MTVVHGSCDRHGTEQNLPSYYPQTFRNIHHRGINEVNHLVKYIN
ncbi:hypothetical protein [Halomicronema sp. CCY15110]|nr:hypothetical protein [Halomicronema sp. CCY15110]